MSNTRPGSEGLLDSAALDELTAAGRRGLALEETRARLGDSAEEIEVERALRRLADRGLAVLRNRRWIAQRFTDWRTGRLRLLASGDGLVEAVEPGGDGGGEWFVRRSDLAGARDGDRVIVKVATGARRRGGRGGAPRATVSRVLDRGPNRIVGTVEIGERRRWLEPFDPKLDLEVEVEGAEQRLEDQFVVVELERGRKRAGPARGKVVEVLGSLDSPGVDVLVLLRHLEIPDGFPPEVLAAAETLPPDPGPGDWAGREDLRDLLTVTIDGESARDFDDAISVEPLTGGRFRIGVHIADVSHYVAEGSTIDQEAYRRGTSVYFPDRAVPMLPESLSNGLCSLRPEVPRLTLSAFLDIGRDGAVERQRFARSVIRSDRRLTYGEVARIFSHPAPEDTERYGSVLDLLDGGRQVMVRLYRRRLQRGSIDFDLPQGDVILDTDGATVGIRPGERNDAHRLIEELMIAANEAVARELRKRDAPALYRVHDPPSPERLAELGELLRTFGLDLAAERSDPGPRALQRVLREVEGRTEEPFVSSLVLRSMQRAVYLPEPRGHFALATEDYTHFTSPIRRYPDLLVHRQLAAVALGGDPAEAERTRLAERLPTLGHHASRTERRAEQAERMILQWKMVRHLEERIGDTFHGRITGVQPFGFFVQLEDYFVDGLVAVRTLEDDYYDYDEASHALTGRQSGRNFRLADRVEVVLTGVDRRRRGLDLAIADLAGAGDGRGARREERRRPARHARGRSSGDGGRERRR